VRKLPMVTADTRPFWTGGEHGELRIYRCNACKHYFHPPAPVCPQCGGIDVGPTAVSGRGTVIACTINHQPWTPEFKEPFSVAIIELTEQPGLRILSNVIGCAPESVQVGMAVKVVFEHVDDVWIPLFESAL
jgi:uncharacterized OB-fold protein